MNRAYNSQSGIVSILTVMFLMIFLSILVVGFIKIVGDEQRQATDNDLSASALEAARSGIEDGKRILLYCKDKANDNAFFGANKPCTNLLQSGASGGDCSVFTKDSGVGNVSGVMNPLKIDTDPTDGVAVGGSSFQQYYTCLTITKDTDNIEQTVNEGTSDIQYLKVNGGGAPSDLTVSWTRKIKGVQYAQRFNTTLFTKDSAWKSGANQFPPVLRLQFIPFTPGNIDLEASETGSRTLFIVPGRTGLPAVPSVNLSADSPRAAAGMQRAIAAPATIAANCTAGDYTCTITVSGIAAAAPGKEFYIRTSVLYSGGATTSVTLGLTGGQTFDGVQPIIDATGRTNDVFRRIRARVSFKAPVTFPEYALETGATYCKDITVADVQSTTYNCP